MKNAAVLKEEAYALIEDSQFDAAKQTIEEALNAAPGDMTVLELYDYWYHVNQQLTREEKLLGQLRMIDKMLELQPGNPRNTDRKGDLLIGLERYEEALNAYKKAFSVEGNITTHSAGHYVRFLKIAKCQLELSKYPEVLESCNNIPATYKQTPHKPLLEAKALIALNRLEEALEKLKVFLLRKSSAIKAAVATHPDFTALWNHEEFMAITSDPDIKQQQEIAGQKNH